MKLNNLRKNEISEKMNEGVKAKIQRYFTQNLNKERYI